MKFAPFNFACMCLKTKRRQKTQQESQRVNLRVKMISGCTQPLESRVSTDQMSLILFQPLDDELSSLEDFSIQDDTYDK
jgi:hypothetical protein